MSCPWTVVFGVGKTAGKGGKDGTQKWKRCMAMKIKAAGKGGSCDWERGGGRWVKTELMVLLGCVRGVCGRVINNMDWINTCDGGLLYYKYYVFL